MHDDEAVEVIEIYQYIEAECDELTLHILLVEQHVEVDDDEVVEVQHILYDVNELIELLLLDIQQMVAIE